MRLPKRTVFKAVSTAIAAAAFFTIGLTTANAQVVDTLTGPTTAATSAGAPTAPTTGTATYYVAPAGQLTLSTPFVYDFGAGTWSAPTGWTQPTAGVFTNGTATVNLTGFTPTINTAAPPPAQWSPTPPSASYATGTYLSQVFGASVGNAAGTSTVTGGTTSSTQETDVYYATPSGTVLVSNGDGNASTTASVLDSTQTFPLSKTGPSAPVPNPGITAPGVTVTSNTPSYNTGQYIINPAGTVSGTAVNLDTGGLVISSIGGTATVNSDGSITANLTQTTATAVTAEGISTTGYGSFGGPVTVGGTLVASGNAYLGGNSETAILSVTGANGVSIKAGTNVDVGGNVLHNVGAGVVGTDAVNLSQLQGVQNQLNNQYNSLSSTVQVNRIEAQRGIASVSALNGIPGLDPNSKFGFGVGVGSYKGQTAFAVGANFRFSEHVTGKLGIGSASGDTTGNAGIGFSF
jgi:hypothetical protein